MQEKRDYWKDILLVMLLAMTVALIIRLFVFANVFVEGHSMMPTLHTDDKILVSQISYLTNSPERFDIIVFQAPEDNEKYYVKRVIGLPGETVAYVDDKLYINGKYIEEPYLEQLKQLNNDGYLTETFNLEEKIGQLKVPEGHVFVLGDNRRYSKDSRHIGAVPIEDIFGKGMFVYWPFEHKKWIK